MLEIIQASRTCSTESAFDRLLQKAMTLLPEGMRDRVIARLYGKHGGSAEESSEKRRVSPAYDDVGQPHEQRCASILRYLIPHLQEAFGRVHRKSDTMPLPPLTQREKEVLRWVREGKSTMDIAVIVGISQNTVKFHLKNIHHKLNTTSRSHALSVALSNRMLDA